MQTLTASYFRNCRLLPHVIFLTADVYRNLFFLGELNERMSVSAHRLPGTLLNVLGCHIRQASLHILV